MCTRCGTVVSQNAIVSEISFGETSGGAAMVQGSYIGNDQSSSTVPCFNSRHSGSRCLCRQLPLSEPSLDFSFSAAILTDLSCSPQLALVRPPATVRVRSRGNRRSSMVRLVLSAPPPIRSPRFFLLRSSSNCRTRHWSSSERVSPECRRALLQPRCQHELHEGTSKSVCRCGVSLRRLPAAKRHSDAHRLFGFA